MGILRDVFTRIAGNGTGNVIDEAKITDAASPTGSRQRQVVTIGGADETDLANIVRPATAATALTVASLPTRALQQVQDGNNLGGNTLQLQGGSYMDNTNIGNYNAAFVRPLPFRLNNNGAFTAGAQTASVPVQGNHSVIASIYGTFVGTVVFEASFDGGTVWFAVQGIRLSDGVTVSDASASGVSVMLPLAQLPAGNLSFRLRVSAFTSGTINYHIISHASQIPIPTALAAAKVATDGSVYVTGRSRTPAGVYSATTTVISGAASAQNWISVENPSGSTKLVWVRRVEIRLTAVAAVSLTTAIQVARPAALPTAGTVLTAFEYDSNYAASTAIARQAPTGTAPTTGIAFSMPFAGFLGTTGALPVVTVVAFEGDGSDVLLRANEALLVSAGVNDADVRVTVTVVWDEV